MNPLYRWRSEPQIAVLVILMMASREFRIFGSGTSLTCTSRRPIQQVAFMTPPPLKPSARLWTPVAAQAATVPVLRTTGCRRAPESVSHASGLHAVAAAETCRRSMPRPDPTDRLAGDTTVPHGFRCRVHLA